METKIINCSCQSTFQDSSYGHGKRLGNKTDSGYRCTVCGTEIRTSSGKR